MVVGTAPLGRRVSGFVAVTVAAARAWGRVLTTSAGVAAVTGAAQLGVGYGLQLVDFRREFTTDDRWASQLTWTAWFATLAVVAGATGGVWAARRLAGDYGPVRRLELGQRIAVALAAGLGAVVTVVLTALPAREAGLPGADPALEAALAALLGVVAGVLVTIAALSVRVVAVSVGALVTVVWLVALVSVVPTLGPAAAPAMVRLGVLDLAAFGAGSRSTVATVSPPVIALLVGVGVAAAARAIGLSMARTILSGATAPVLLAIPYLIAPPRGGEDSVQASAFLGAVIAVAAGMLAAFAIAVVRLPGRRPPEPEPAGTTPPPGHPDAGGIAPAYREPPEDVTAGGYGGHDAGGQAGPPASPAWPPTTDPRPGRQTSDATAPADAGTPAAGTPAARTPAAGTPGAGTPAPDPPTVAAGAAPAAPPADDHARAAAPATSEPSPSTPAPAAAPRRRRRPRHEDEHVDWVRSLGGGENDAPELAGGGRRRLRRDRNLPTDPDIDPELPLADPHGGSGRAD